jgi:hypothetical protein
VALVDDRIVSVGAEVPAGRIVEIEPEAIVIGARGGERRRIELSRLPLQPCVPSVPILDLSVWGTGTAAACLPYGTLIWSKSRAHAFSLVWCNGSD